MFGSGFNRASEPIVACMSNSCYPVYGHEGAYEYHRENVLTENEKIVYDEILESYLQFRTDLSTSLDHLTVDELNNAFKAVILDHPEIFWTRTFASTNIFGNVNTSRIIRLNYFYSKEDAIKIKEEIEPKYNAIIQEAKKYNTDFDKIKYVHDKLIEIGTYEDYKSDEEGDFQSFVSIFRDGRTVCSGYAYAFKYIMDNLGIKSAIIADINDENSSEESHIWNAVQSDGKWYNLDITYDDQISEERGYTCYTYFMVKNEIFYLDHEMQNDVPRNEEW